MKKSLLAVAVLGAFAGSALAADVTLYGIVDTGLRFNHVDPKGATSYTMENQNKTGGYDYAAVKYVGKKSNSLSMDSGIQSGSRWGLKGTEQLGNGYSVGFVLESGINSDTGTGNSQLFNRESTVNVATPFGKFYAGRMGAVVGAAGSVSKISMISAFGTSWSKYVPQVQSTMYLSDRLDNAIAYESPNFAGLVIRAQYAMGADGSENKASGTRYAGIAATYNNGPLALFAGVDRNIYGHEVGKDVDDSLSVTLGGSYDFGVAKVFGGAQYFDEVLASRISGLTYHSVNATVANPTTALAKMTTVGFSATSKLKGYGLNLSASAPVLGGVAMVGASYMDASEADSTASGTSFDYDRYQIAVGFTYPFSKRTNIYTVASYGKDKLKFKNATFDDTVKPSYASAMLGLRHTF